MTLTQPLDLQYWLVDTFSGSMEIFVIVSIVIITMLCAKFRMPFGAFIGIIVLFSAIIGGAYGSAMLALLILVGSLVIFSIIRKAIEQ